MLSTLYHQQFARADGSDNPPKNPRSWLGGYRADEIAIFALVAVAVLYIAIASCWFAY